MVGNNPASSGQAIIYNGSQWGIQSLSGDATLAGSGAITLASVGTQGTQGGATAVPIITTDAKGRVTSITTAAPLDGTKLPTSGGTLSGSLSGTTAAFTTAPSNTVSANVGTVQVGATLGYSDVNILQSTAESINNYTQVIIQNTSAGSQASANFNISNDQGSSTTNFGEIGINSSGFQGDRKSVV